MKQKRMSRWGIGVRALATVVGLGLLTWGQVAHTNDLFPFGVMGQYANAKVMNASVTSTYLEVTEEGSSERVRIPLSRASVALERSEIEGQLRRIVAHPELLQDLANAYHRLHPDKPPLTELFLQRSTKPIIDGRVSDDEKITPLAQWRVRS